MSGAVAGRNSRLDEIQAAVLRVKLVRLEGWNQRRRLLAAAYHELLSPEVKKLVLPSAGAEHESHVFHLYVVRHPERERLRAHLAARGVETLIHYPAPLHLQTLFRRRGQPPLPAAERLTDEILSLPLYPQLRDEELRAVADAVLEFEAG